MAKLKDRYPNESIYNTSVVRRSSNTRSGATLPNLPELWGVIKGSDFLLVYASPGEIKRELDRPEQWDVSFTGPGKWIGQSVNYPDDPLQVRYIDSDGDEVENATDVLLSLYIVPENDPEGQLISLGLVHR